jgi:uncharacterized membrane protein
MFAINIIVIIIIIIYKATTTKKREENRIVATPLNIDSNLMVSCILTKAYTLQLCIYNKQSFK